MRWISIDTIPEKIYQFKVNNKNARKVFEICSKLTIKTPGRRYLRRSGIVTLNFEYISYIIFLYFYGYFEQIMFATISLELFTFDISVK